MCSERAAITEVVTHLAVSHPQEAFKLSEEGAGGAGGRELLSLPKAKDLRERLARLYGVGKARTFRRVNHEHGPFRLTGYAALPSLTYASRSACQNVSVNGRWATAESFNRGLDDAYRGTVAAGRYPPVALQIEVDPRAVDVNVHPTKHLVRFSDERAAKQAIADAVKLAIEWREQRTSVQQPVQGPVQGPVHKETPAERALRASSDGAAFTPPSAAARPLRAEGGEMLRSRKGGKGEEGRLFEQPLRGYPEGGTLVAPISKRPPSCPSTSAASMKPPSRSLERPSRLAKRSLAARDLASGGSTRTGNPSRPPGANSRWAGGVGIHTRGGTGGGVGSRPARSPRAGYPRWA